MEDNSEKLNLNCGICGAKNARFWFEKNSFNLYKCEKCGLIFTESILDVSKIYSEDYFSGAKNSFGYVDYDKDKQAMVGTFEFYLDKIKEFSASGGNLLDVGAATGYFLELAKQRNWNTMGVEISPFASEKARAKGLNVITGTLENLNIPDEYFNVITFWDVIEHFSDPKSQLLLARKILKKGGLIAVNTPDAGSFAAKMLGKHWHLLVPPEHLLIFNQKNLSALLQRQGFEVLFTAKMGKKFTVQYIFQILANWRRDSVLFKKLAKFFVGNFLGKIFFPVNLRDNFFIIARKYENN